MAKSIRCSDVGVDCDWSATAKTEEELLEKIKKHAVTHGYHDIPKELVAKVKSSIKDI